MIDKEKLKYDLALQYAQMKSSQYEQSNSPDAICGCLAQDFAIAYHAINDFTEEFWKILLHEGEL